MPAITAKPITATPITARPLTAYQLGARVGGAAWTPAKLFSDGAEGVWYDPSDLSTLFQDSSGTTPVTAAGQPVGYIADKSGNGYHAIQATAEDRPILRADSNGRYYLEITGAGQELVSSTPSLGTDASVITLVDYGSGVLQNQSIAADYAIDESTYGVTLIDREITSDELLSVADYATSKAVGPIGGGVDIFVSSVDGDDGNDGLTEVTALETLTAASAAALSAGDGVRIGLKRGSSWADSLLIGSLDNAVVAAYGFGDLPEIDCADAITSWTKTGGRTNVYDATGPVAKFVNGDHPVWEDGWALIKQTSVAAVDATAGSYYADISGANPVYYIHATGSGDPTSNGKLYEIATREIALDLASTSVNTYGNTVSGVITARNGTNDGSTRMAYTSDVRNLLCSDGHKHSLMVSSGSIEDTVLFRVNRNNTGNNSPLISYYATEDDAQTLSIKRLFIIGDPPSGVTRVGQVALLNHTGVSKPIHTSIQVEQLAIVDFTTANLFKDSASASPTYNGVYLENTTSIGETGTEDLYIVNNCMANGASGWSIARGWGVCTLTNYASYKGAPIWKQTGMSIANSVLINDAFCHRGYSGLYDTSINFSSTYTVYAVPVYANGSHLSVDAGTYTGDYNVFCSGGASEVRIYDRLQGAAGTEYTTLAAWQSASGQDANSVYLTSAQYSAFWLNDPSTGDFRINPDAEVTGADGTIYTGEFPDGTPITRAGPQTHWDWNARSEASGPPTQWPAIPSSYAESAEYVKSPSSWDFYP